MANNQAFKIKNGLSAKRYLQNSTAVSASDADLSTGSYFTKTLSANTTFTFSNPPASGKAMGFALEVTGGSATVGYDLANASYDSVASTPLTASNKSLFISPDGLNLYTTTSQTVQQHTMTTAWDLSTLPATASKTFSVSSQESGPEELFFKPDGTKMYVIGETNDTVFQYSLSTAWDVSTASYDSKSFAVDPSNPRACWFKPDGTRLFTCGPVSDKIFSYDLSTAWDVSTASSGSKVEVSIGSYSAALNSFAMSDDGTKIFIGSNATPSDTIVQLDLTTAWDLSTLTSNSISFSYASQEDQINGLFFKDDGTKMYIGGQITSTSIYQYSTSASATATTTWPSSVKWSGATAPDAPASGEKDVYVFVTTDGGTTYYGKQAGDAVA